MSECRIDIHNPIISCWFQINPDLFILIKENVTLWAEIPERFKEPINMALRELNDDYIEKSAEEVLSNLPNISKTKLNSFLVSLGKATINKKTSEDWICKIVDKGSTGDRIAVISYLSHIFKNDVNSIAYIIYIVVSKEAELNNEMISNLWINLDIDPQKINQETLKKLRKELFDKLIPLPIINYEVQGILDFLLDNVDTLFNFIEQRIEYYTTKKEKSYYSPLPFEGFNYIRSDRIKM